MDQIEAGASAFFRAALSNPKVRPSEVAHDPGWIWPPLAGRVAPRRISVGATGSRGACQFVDVNVWRVHDGQTRWSDMMFKYAANNVQCVGKTEILVEQQLPRGVLIWDDAGILINKLSGTSLFLSVTHTDMMVRYDGKI